VGTITCLNGKCCGGAIPISAGVIVWNFGVQNPQQYYNFT